MQFNQYTAYSFISQTENKNSAENKKVLVLIENISKIKTINEAKEFIKQTYKIQDSVKNFSLGGNNFLNVNENSKKYTLQISYKNNDENECVIFNYKK